MASADLELGSQEQGEAQASRPEKKQGCGISSLTRVKENGACYKAGPLGDWVEQRLRADSGESKSWV